MGFTAPIHAANLRNHHYSYIIKY